MPNVAAARQSSDGSPSGSAAASSSSRRASAVSGCKLPEEALLDPLRETARAQQPEAARQFRGRQVTRQLEQRQRITPRLGDDAIGDALVELEPHRGAEQLTGVPIAHALHLQRRQLLEIRARFARGEDDPDLLGQQAAGDERQRQRRCMIKPLRVVDDAQQRPLVGQLGEQAQHGQADQEPVRRGAGAEPEHDLERVTLRRRKARQPTQQRAAQLMQAGEGQLHLGFDPDRARDGHVRRRRDQVPAAAPSFRCRPRPGAPTIGPCPR